MEPSHLASPALRLAEAPFNHGAADVVFVTSDDVEFHLFKAILMLSSCLFNDVFSAKESRPDPQEPFRVAEDSATFDCLLRLCYPVPPPDFNDLQLLGSVLEAAVKYRMVEVANRARAHLDRFTETKPLEVFVLAYKLRLETQARKAADVWNDAAAFDDGADFKKTVAGAAYTPSMASGAGVRRRVLPPDSARLGHTRH